MSAFLPVRTLAGRSALDSKRTLAFALVRKRPVLRIEVYLDRVVIQIAPEPALFAGSEYYRVANLPHFCALYFN